MLFFFFLTLFLPFRPVLDLNFAPSLNWLLLAKCECTSFLPLRTTSATDLVWKLQTVTVHEHGWNIFDDLAALQTANIELLLLFFY